MKNFIKYILQSIFGINSYLYLFSIFKIRTLKWDKKENDFFAFLEQIKGEGIILDVGANIGIMTVHLAKRFNNSTIFSFEPIDCNHKTLKRIIALFKLKNVIIQHCAIGNENGQLEMILPKEGKVLSPALSHIVHDSITEFNEGIKSTIPVKRLDDMEELKDKKPIVAIKLDVENAEYFVLQGAKELITKHRPVIYTELWDNDNRTKCFKLIQELDYKIYISDKENLVHYDPATHRKQNFIFLNH